MSEKSEAQLLEDFDGVNKLYSDGSVVREDDSSYFFLLPDHDTFSYKHVEYKDVVMDEATGLWARVFLAPEMKTKAPVIMYYHGSGFCVFNATTPIVHRACQTWAATLGAVIVSVNYRLAPEHRLPCAYHDSIATLQWLQLQFQAAAAEEAEPWLRCHADFCRVYLAGDSAGGNIAHHVGVWAAGRKTEIEIKGLILVYPYFGGEESTSSERENSPVFSLEKSDALWRLALPVGSNRDHPFSNPLIEGAAAASTLDLPPMLFVIAGKDILRDRQLKYCEHLQKCGKRIRVHVCDEEDHGFLFAKMEEPSSVQALRTVFDFIKRIEWPRSSVIIVTVCCPYIIIVLCC